MSANQIRIFAPTPEGQATPPLVTSQPTVRQILDWYEDSPRPTKSQMAEVERRRNWAEFKSKHGARLVTDCKPFDLLNWINAQPRVKSDWTRRRLNATIQAPFNFAEKMQLIVKNPFRGCSFPGGENGRDWTRDEYFALLKAASNVYRRLIVFLRFSGLRPEEACELQWPHVRFEAGSIIFSKHKTRHHTNAPRAVPLNSSLVKLLGWLKRNNPPGTKNVFLNSFGRPLKRTMATTTLRRLRRKVGLPEDVKLHGARHTFGTNAAINGVEIAALMEILGHRRLATTERYLHVAGKTDHLKESMEKAVISPKPKAAEPRPPVKRPDPPMPLFDGME